MTTITRRGALAGALSTGLAVSIAPVAAKATKVGGSNNLSEGVSDMHITNTSSPADPHVTWFAEMKDLIARQEDLERQADAMDDSERRPEPLEPFVPAHLRSEPKGVQIQALLGCLSKSESEMYGIYPGIHGFLSVEGIDHWARFHTLPFRGDRQTERAISRLAEKIKRDFMERQQAYKEECARSRWHILHSEMDRLCNEALALADRILETPAATVAGARIQIETLGWTMLGDLPTGLTDRIANGLAKLEPTT